MTPEELSADLMAGLMDGSMVSHLTIVEMPPGHVHYTLTYKNGRISTYHLAVWQEPGGGDRRGWRRVICRLCRG